MKIAFVTDVIYPFSFGGSEIRNHEIAKRLVKRGHEVHIYGAKLWKGNDIIKVDNVIIHGISKYKIYNKNGRRKIRYPLILAIKTFLKLIREKYDLIDVASFVYFECYSMKLFSLIKKIPLVFTWHQYLGDYLIGYFGKTIGNIGIVLEELSTKLTKNNIAVSRFVKSELLRKGRRKEYVKVIYNGADINLINSTKARSKKFDLIFVGRLNYQKNLKLLIESINLLIEDFPEIKICIIGEGEEKNKLINSIKKLGLGKNFHFTGLLKDKEEIFSYMKSSRIFVLPSLLEGFPLTMIEANACELPVITTKTKHNNTSEYIEENKNGILVPPNPNEFSRAISDLLKNNKLREKMSKAGIKKAKDFDWDKIAEEQEKYYLNILKK